MLLPLVVAAIFVVAGAALVLLVNRHMRQQALYEAEAKARLLLAHNLAIHTYFTHDLKPALFASLGAGDGETFQAEWMSSTYAVRLIDGYFQELTPLTYYYKEAAVDARSPENEADAYERAVLASMAVEPSLVSQAGIRYLDGAPYFVVLHRGEVMEAACLRCHSTPEEAPAELVARYGPERSFGRHEGDLVSAISIRIPLQEAYAAAARVSPRCWGSSSSTAGILPSTAAPARARSSASTCRRRQRSQLCNFLPVCKSLLYLASNRSGAGHLGQSGRAPDSRS